ncbi:adenylate kinase [Clostridium homopropionicum DSM 5847]|uniref:Adenylate kinase n=1 Tax=Clostridium homopropionicum DSM 5847 TaxID=1121318 RepID=A0A0L6Z5S7_9CLOT|nr:ATP-binding protein [Clostridium homopropionicum]KOA18319.1 adenylate kinase [Clostridium homopropionicum DSM 5847]SFF69231.1 adenylate kinase [Clostridium homopropionicum]
MDRIINKKIIFVAGIHGVGKTTLCKKISQILSLKHYSASELIMNFNLDVIRKDKKVSDISENQNILLDSIERYLNDEEYYLLDGHFSLLDTNGNITEVPLDTFKSLGLKAIIVLVDEESEILKKLISRDKGCYQIKLIKKFQEKEICYAKEVAESIGIKCKIVNVNSDIDQLVIFINDILNK